MLEHRGREMDCDSTLVPEVLQQSASEMGRRFGLLQGLPYYLFGNQDGELYCVVSGLGQEALPLLFDLAHRSIERVEKCAHLVTHLCLCVLPPDLDTLFVPRLVSTALGLA